jgi:hypothetical protein
MDVKEHLYADDPSRGHPDVRTNLPGTEYYFLGNGLIQAALQVSRHRQATPLGLLLMNPEVLGPKRASLSLDADRGLGATALILVSSRDRHAARHGRVSVRRTEADGIPGLRASWSEAGWLVTEFFFCPDRTRPRLVRDIRVRNTHQASRTLTLRTGLKDEALRRTVRFRPGQERSFFIEYLLARRGHSLSAFCSWCGAPAPAPAARAFWTEKARIRFHHPLLDHLFKAARHQLPAVVAGSGKLDGSIWQYNLEWVRDQALVSEALAALGFLETARTILDRILDSSVAEDGATFDSSRRRPREECEFDQNGVLLSALDAYAAWSGDTAFLRRRWPDIRRIAEFPLRPSFRSRTSGLLHNQREFWERHAAHGIEDGFELAHHLFVARGLGSAAGIARLLGKDREAERWLRMGWRLRRAAFEDKRSRFVDQGHLFKRRLVSGEVERQITPEPTLLLATDVPLFQPGRHLLDPDTSTSLPIALGFIPPRSGLAGRTLGEIEKLWNQRWTGGGYGRYHVSSEPDSPGPWSFASLFVARAYFEAGKDAKVWRVLNWLRRIQGGRAGSWFEFYGPRPVPPCPQVGIIPWTWVEIISLLVRHMLGVRPTLDGLLLRPRLPAGIKKAEAEIPLRGRVLKLDLEKAGRGSRPAVWIGGRRSLLRREGVFLPYERDENGATIRITTG